MIKPWIFEFLPELGLSPGSPRVVVGEHGWWQHCDELDAPGYDPLSPDGANFNLTVDPTIRDPISGTPSHRANLCEIRLIPTAILRTETASSLS